MDRPICVPVPWWQPALPSQVLTLQCGPHKREPGIQYPGLCQTAPLVSTMVSEAQAPRVHSPSGHLMSLSFTLLYL